MLKLRIVLRYDVWEPVPPMHRLAHDCPVRAIRSTIKRVYTR